MSDSIGDADQAELVQLVECKAPEAMIQVILDRHPHANCTDDTCAVCSYRDCGFKDLMHYSKDGCPSCSASVRS